MIDTHSSAWPLELGLWTPTLRHGPSSWGDGLSLTWPPKWADGLPPFGQVSQVGVMDSHLLMWPLEVGPRTPTLSLVPAFVIWVLLFFCGAPFRFVA